MNRANVDDATEAAGAHAWQHGASHQERPFYHHVDQQIPFLDWKLFELGDVLEAGVVDKGINGYLASVAHKPFDVLLGCYVKAMRLCLATRRFNLSYGFSSAFQATISCNDRMTCLRQANTQAATQAAAS